MIFRPRIRKSLLFLTLAVCFSALVYAETQTAKSAKTGAGWGALAGLVFGGSVWDMAEGAIVGAAGGAVYGSMKAKEQQKQEQIDISKEEAEQRLRLEEERNRILATTTRQTQTTHQSGESTGGQTGESIMADRALLERAFGADNVEGLYALRDCQLLICSQN